MRQHVPASFTANEPAHVVITGASGGLGRALAGHYAENGRLLSLTGRDAGRLETTAEICRQKGATVSVTVLDITDADAVAGWLLARDEACAIDLLIANAGMGGGEVLAPENGEDGPLARSILAVNALGVINTVTPILPRMIARRRGRLALIGSISGAIGLPQSPAYCASKAAVEIYGDGLRRLVARHGVGLTVVLPGFVDTPMSRSLGMKRPFVWPAEKAARRIARDIGRGAPRCVFPLPFRLGIGLAKFLPEPVSDFILTRLDRIV